MKACNFLRLSFEVSFDQQITSVLKYQIKGVSIDAKYRFFSVTDGLVGIMSPDHNYCY